MRVDPTRFPDAAALGRALATVIADRLGERPPGQPFVLGCPGGRSPSSTYRALADEVGRKDLDLSGLIIVMMDEYVETDAFDVPRRIDPRAPHSCVRFGRDDIVARLNAAARPGRQILPEHYWTPDPLAGERYDADIAELGGVDLFILASGASDGHIAFNPPGAPRDSKTRVVALGERTRRDNLGTFPSFGGQLDRVPRHGVTVGIETIRRLSKQVVMVAHGAHKATAVGRLCAAQSYEPDWPATVLAECCSPQLFVDEAAFRGAAVATPCPHR